MLWVLPSPGRPRTISIHTSRKGQHHHRNQVRHQEGSTSVFRRLKGKAQKISQADGPANQG
jgi:hypothetical protein